jgi:hypothetical protein
LESINVNIVETNVLKIKEKRKNYKEQEAEEELKKKR